LEIQLSRWEGWDPVNRLNHTPCVCLSQATTWISNALRKNVFYTTSGNLRKGSDILYRLMIEVKVHVLVTTTKSNFYINRINHTPCVCLSQATTWISNDICRSLFSCSITRGDCALKLSLFHITFFSFIILRILSRI
jgi:hypothetical protein